MKKQKKTKVIKTRQVVPSQNMTMTLMWIPSISDEVSSQRVRLSMMLDNNKQTHSTIDVPAQESECELTLIKGKMYTAIIESQTAAGDLSLSAPLVFIAGSGVPMPATELGVVTSVPLKQKQEKPPDFPNGGKKSTSQEAQVVKEEEAEATMKQLEDFVGGNDDEE